MVDLAPLEKRYAVGVMTGTSIDGIDAALVRIDGHGLAMKASLVHHVSRPLGDLQRRLRLAADQHPMTAGDFAQLGWAFGNLHALVVEDLLASARFDGPNLSLICVHGQTVFHQPPVSWQLINPAPIAHRFGCPVIGDLRQSDLAAGGQGAPITPIADWIMFRDQHKRRAIVNLGGFCNVTILPAANSTGALNEIRGMDVCPCNHILDAVARQALNKPFDNGGAAAMAGTPDATALQQLLQILDNLRAQGRSLGTGDESLQWLAQQRERLKPNDLAATAVKAIALTIGKALIKCRVDELILAGGGVRNAALRAALERASGTLTRTSCDFNVPIEARESMAFAILGSLRADQIPITLPQVTGCSSPAPLSGVVHSTV